MVFSLRTRMPRLVALPFALLCLSGCGGSVNGLLEDNTAPEITQITINGVPGKFSDTDPTAVTLVATTSVLSLVCQAKDKNRDPLTYKWSTSGPANTLTASGDTDVATLNVATDGEITVTCTVDDGRTGVTSRSIRIKATTTNNHPPTLSLTAAPMTVAPGGAVILTATATDQDNDTLSYSFSAISTADGSAAGTVTPSAADKTKAVFIAPAATGTYLIVCVVSDGKGGSATKTASITVTAP